MIIATCNGIEINCSSSGVFSATVGRRKLVANTLVELRGEIDGALEELAGEQRKDVSIYCRVRIGDKVRGAYYLGMRATSGGWAKHVFRVDGEKELVTPDDYCDGIHVLPDSTEQATIVEFELATAALEEAQRRKTNARAALCAKRAPSRQNEPTSKNSDRVKAQARFVKELLAILGREVRS